VSRGGSALDGWAALSAIGTIGAPSAAVAIAWWAIDLLIWSVLAQTKQSAMREAHVGARPAQPLARAPPYVPEQLEHRSGALTPLLQQFQQPENWEGPRASPASDVGGPGRVLAPDRGLTASLIKPRRGPCCTSSSRSP
jgi:hypothetical protein